MRKIGKFWKKEKQEKVEKQAKQAEGFSAAARQTRLAALYCCGTQESVLISRPVFPIGKEKRGVGYAVGSNAKVSERYADIIARGQRYYIKDLDAENRTFVNGAMIPKQQEVELFSGDRIRLADEEFEFYM